MKIKTGEIVDKNKDKNVVSSVKLSKGTRVGTLKLTVNGEEQDSVPIRGLGGGSSTVIGGSVDTQALWDAINKKVDIDFFKNLFTVYDSSDIEIATNTYTRKPDNLKISVGTWTEEYLSALGKNSESGGGGGVGTVIGIALGTGTTPIYPDDDTGIVTLPAYPTKVSQLTNDSGFVTSSTLNNYVTSSYLANNFYTKAQADSKYMTIAAFESLFNALDSNGDKINHPYSSGVDSVKALVGLWTEEYLSALGQNSEGGSSGGGSVNAIKVGTNPDTYLDPVEGIIDMSDYVTTAAQRTLWTNSAHTHSNKAVLDNITAGQVTAWNNVAAIMGEDQDNIINKWNEVVAFLSTYTEADTLANLLSNKLDVEFFRRIFTVYDEDGNIIVPNTYTQVADNLKILVGTWTEEYLSALGKNSEGGGGGTGTVTSVKIASNPDVFIDPVDGIIDMSSYATTWSNKQDAISDLATIRSNASNGNTAYSWGNHANAGYAQASNTVSNVAYNTTGKKLTKTINGNTTDIVSASTLVTDGGGAKASTTITAGNGLTGGGDLSSNRTINVVSANAAITVNADNIKLNVINDYTTTTNNTIIPLAAAKGKDLNDRLAVLESWFEVDSDGNVKTKDMPNGTHRGFYTESFVSALGSNSSGGGSGADLEDVWDSLTNQQGTVITDNTKIAIAHIPDTSSTYGYLKASSLSGYATQTWVNQQGFLTTHQSIYALTLKAGGTAVTTFTPNSADASLDFVAGTNISLTRGTNQISIANTYSYTLPLAASGTRGGVQIGYSETNSGTSTTRNYAVKLSSEKMYVNVPWTDTTYKLTLNGTTNGASGGTSLGSFYAPTAVGTDGYVLKSSGSGAPSWVAQSTLSVGDSAKLNGQAASYYATASNVTTLQGYFTSGAAKNAVTTLDNTNTLYLVGVVSNATTTLKHNSSVTIKGGALTTTGNVSIGGALSVTSGITLTTTKKIYFGDTSHYLELDSTGFHFSHGVYSDSFVSALGANSSGGGGSGTFDEEAMWEALGTTSSAKVIASSHIPNLSASKITSGTLADARIPSLAASKITSGTFDTARIPNLDASKITSGTFAAARIPDLSGRYYALYGGTNLNPSSSNAVNLNNLLSVGSYYCASDVNAQYVSNKPITNNLAFRVWVSATIGTSGNYLRQRFQSRSQVAIFERVVGIGSGTVQPSDWGNWYLVQNDLNGYALASSLNNYLPLSGGTLTGSLTVHNSGVTALGYNAKFDVDTSREMGLAWLNTSGTRVASVTYHNTNKNIIINPIGSSNTWEDVVGKYSLFVGNNKLTYNTYPILHSNNYSSYALPLSGGTMSGPLKWVSASLPQTTTPNFLLTIDSFADGGTTKWALLSDVLVGKATADGDGNTISSTYLKLTGGTLTGDLLIKANLTCRCDMFQGTNPALGALDQGTSSFRAGSNSIEPAAYGCFIWTDWTYGATKFQGGYSNGTKATLPLAFQPLGGNVGIGTDSPSTPLHVKSSQGWAFHSYSSASSSFSSFYASNSGGQGMYCGTSSTASSIYVAAFYKGTTGDGSGGSAVMYMRADGKIGIGNSSPSEVLHVTGNILASGEVTASSDERLKIIVGDGNLDLRYIANAPNILFKWNNGQDDKVHGGSLAQYFLTGAKHFVLGNDKDYYSLNYGALATSMAISIAKEVVKHDNEITRLKKVVVKQAKEIVDLKNKVREFEERRVA